LGITAKDWESNEVPNLFLKDCPCPADLLEVRRLGIAIYLTTMLALASAYFMLSPAPTPLTKLGLYNGVGLLSLLGTLVGIRVHKPVHRTPWVLFALGQASFLTGDVLYYWLETHNETVPVPSIADAFYLMMYPLVLAGLALKIRKSSNGTKDWAGLIDAGIFGIAMFSVLWVLVMDSYVPIDGNATTERIILLLYPVMDLAVIFMAIRLAVVLHRAKKSLALIIGALVFLVIADVQYGMLNAKGSFQTGSIVDAFWLAFYVSFALAALHPSMAQELRSESNQFARITNLRLVLMFVATLTVPFIDLIWGTPSDRFVTLISSAVLFALMLGRVLGLVRTVEHGRELLHSEARHDPLTGLANRTQFSERTLHALKGGASSIAVLLIDLDDFKTVNDSLGHEAGDEVLVEVASRIRRCIRETDVAARLGGDEFAVLIAKTIDAQDAANTASRIIKALSEPMTIMNRQIRVGGSVGVALQTAEQGDVQALLRGADVAMYQAKRQGKGRYAYFEQHQYTQILDRLRLKDDLELAIQHNQFEVYYQPILDTDSAVVRSVEALVRWNHPERGLISPVLFIPIAEETGQINLIGRWVLNESCRQVRLWQMQIPHCRELRASVNLSARQLHDPELLRHVTEALRTSGLAPECLTLEVTESLLVADSNSTRTLQQLTALKVKIAIDDFGTGYSSLSYLHTFPVDTIKIDQSFVQKLDESATSHALVRTVIDLARAVGGITVAEGVETQRQLDILSELQCDLVQGYLFSRPVPAREFAELLTRRNRKEQVLPLPVKALAVRNDSEHGLRVEVLQGLRQVEKTLPQLEAFHARVSAPVSARWPWLSSWFKLHPEAELICVVVRSISDELEAAALLGKERTGERVRLFSINNQMANVASMFAASSHAADLLAGAIADLVRGSKGEWALELHQIAGTNEVASAMAKHLPSIVVEPQLSVPQVLLTEGMSLDSLLSKSMRKALRRVHTRLVNRSSEWQVDFYRGSDKITALLPEIEEIHIGRDHAQRNVSDLDDVLERRFWQETIVTHTYADELEVATLSINGAIASYVISLIDGDCYRVLDGRMNGAYAEFSPGRILESATLERVLGDSSFATFDWMTGVAPDTILAANFWQPRHTLLASSLNAELHDLVNSKPPVRTSTNTTKTTKTSKASAKAPAKTTTSPMVLEGA
jgi:diguanylate cyclase